MNERIEQLAQQAGLIAGEHDDLDFKKNLTDKEKKFAELIVRECGNYMNSRIPGNIEVSATVAKMKKHFGVDQYNEQEALNRAGDDIARDIDRQVILQAGLIHEGGGYAISTHEKQAEFAAKRNYTYSDIVSDGGMDPRK